MFESFPAGQDQPVRFLLIARDAVDGLCEIVLHLYRGDTLASTTVVSIVPVLAARMMCLLSRLHLTKLGCLEHAPRLPRAAGLAVAS
jgi:hypothetical protein